MAPRSSQTAAPLLDHLPKSIEWDTLDWAGGMALGEKPAFPPYATIHQSAQFLVFPHVSMDCVTKNDATSLWPICGRDRTMCLRTWLAKGKEHGLGRVFIGLSPRPLGFCD